MPRVTIDQAMQIASRHHQAGSLRQAEVIYRQVLARQPAHPDALHHLGLIAHQVGRHDIAVDLIRRAIAQLPAYAEAHGSLGNALKATGQVDQAIAAYRTAIALRPNFAEAYCNLADALRDNRQFDQAAAAAQQAIALRPNLPEAHNNLGNSMKDLGRLDDAIAAFRQAISLRPGYAEAHGNLGGALQERGHRDEAVAVCRQAAALNPKLFEAHVNLGNSLRDIGLLDDAIAAYRQAISLRPTCAQAHNSLGMALQERGVLDEAIAVYGQAIALRPEFAPAHSNLGSALQGARLFDDALAACRRAVALEPNLPEGHLNLGNSLLEQGQIDGAIAAYRQAIALRPNFSRAYSNLGGALQARRLVDDAIAACRRAIALEPNLPEAHVNLGAALLDQGQIEQAIAAYRQAIALRPAYPEAHNNLGDALQEQGRLDEAIATYRHAIALLPGLAKAHSNLLLGLHYHANYDATAIADEHRRWNHEHAEPLKSLVRDHANDPNPDRRLRIGYVSPDFREHAAAPMVLPLLECHDRGQFEVFCYAQVQDPDAMTQRFRARAYQWLNTFGLSDEQVADRIRRDKIDILVDLAGHTAGNRLLVFARKPAPVQVTRQGYPNTTGLTAIDYRMTDAYADPPGRGDALHSEQLVRLPRTNWIYQPSRDCPMPDRRPAGAAVRFGCFNNFTKVTETTLQAWAKILALVPGSTLLLKAKALASPDVRQRVSRIFNAVGIPMQRVDMAGWERSAASHLALYNRIDIGLDPFPYHGTTTTCEALWMGVPVITLAGETHVSRVGVSLLTNVGLAELVAQSTQEYITIAVRLAHDRLRLDNLHSTLRQMMARSPLMDAPSFARDIEAAYRLMWRTWCERASNERRQLPFPPLPLRPI